MQRWAVDVKGATAALGFVRWPSRAHTRDSEVVTWTSRRNGTTAARSYALWNSADMSRTNSS